MRCADVHETLSPLSIRNFYGYINIYIFAELYIFVNKNIEFLIPSFGELQHHRGGHPDEGAAPHHGRVSRQHPRQPLLRHHSLCFGAHLASLPVPVGTDI